MSKFRDTVVELRKSMFALVDEMRRIGDFGAGASYARRHAEAFLAYLDHVLEKMK